MDKLTKNIEKSSEEEQLITILVMNQIIIVEMN